MQPAQCLIPGIINGDTDIKVWFKLAHNLDKNLNLHWFHSIYKCTGQSHKSPKVVEIASISPIRPNTDKNTLREIDGTEMVPLGHCLMVRKTVPFGADFLRILPETLRTFLRFRCISYTPLN